MRVASVAWPQSATSTVGVNQREIEVAVATAAVTTNAVSERFISAATDLHPRLAGRRVEQAHRGRVAAERVAGERVDAEERDTAIRRPSGAGAGTRRVIR